MNSAQLSLPAEPLSIDSELEVTVKLEQAASAEESGQSGQRFDIPLDEVEGSDLNLLLKAHGFQFLAGSVASLPFLDLARGHQPQIARFRLLAIHPGETQIAVALYHGSNYKGEIKEQVKVAEGKEQVEVAEGDESSSDADLVLEPRPVALADYILQVHTRWHDERGAAFSFHYHLTSTHTSLLLTSGVEADSDILSTEWMEALREEWQQLLRETKVGVVQRPRLATLGRYLYQTLLPKNLQQEFKTLWGLGRSLLLITDQGAWLPWELLYDGHKFLAERVIIGRWLRELGNVPPYEFPVGQVSVAYYENAAQEHPWWLELIKPPGSPRAVPLPDGMLEASTEPLRGLHLLRYGEKYAEDGAWEAPVLFADANRSDTIKRQVQPIKLSLRRNRPLVNLSYLNIGFSQLTSLIEQWAPTFVQAGCSAFVGPLWTVLPVVEAAFISGFYHHLWTGDSLGEAFQAGRHLARAAAPESLDWLAYTFFGDPMARPYRPVKGPGYVLFEMIGQSIDEPLQAGISTRCRVGLRRTPPVWFKERVIEVEEELRFENPCVYLVAFDLQVEPNGPISLVRTPQGDYLGWFNLVAAPEMAGQSVELQVHFADGRQPLHSLMLSFDVISGQV